MKDKKRHRKQNTWRQLARTEQSEVRITIVGELAALNGCRENFMG
jgi:hypothetical protein